MKIYRGGRTSRTWSETDAKSLTVGDWRPNKVLRVDGTINKKGQRHTDLGVKIEAADIVSLFNALVEHYQEVERENLELKESVRALEVGFKKIQRLVSSHRDAAPDSDQMLDVVKDIAWRYMIHGGYDEAPAWGWVTWDELG